MKVTNVYIERTFNLGNYESLKVGFEASLSETDKPLEVTAALEDLAFQHYQNRTTKAPQTIPPTAPAKSPFTHVKTPSEIANENTTKKRDLIAELKDLQKKVYVKAQVMEKTEPHTVTTAQGPTETTYVWIADESGRIKLSLWGEQVKQVNVTDNVTIEDGYVSSYKGEIQCNIGKYGKLTVTSP
jgi:replication factor A1